ncbi:peroxiredoxin [Sphingomonas flavalba]|uniref:peroxiredoxin n=1 Tax=Sphingomonas flavalba TaxID=2559804 RepID=UPI001EF09CD1|nr:peroxiredoxin [Sphingomonas flavalba]
MRGLTLIVLTADRERLDAAIAVASATAALGGRSRLYLHDRAVALLHGASLDDALALGVEVIACQSGLAAAGLALDRFDPRIAGGGLVSLLAEAGDDRIITA